VSTIDNLNLKLGGDVPADLFTTTANGIVEEFEKDPLAFDKKTGRPKNGHITTTQIRRFYNDLLSIKSQIDLADYSERAQKLKLQIPYINMLITKARYARSREYVGEKFIKFMEKSISPLNPEKPEESYKHFLLFCSLFEAVIAYSSEKLGTK
jgi:CRISPR type III-A-associated protein Csm2